jgi:hypothetical protein
MKKNMLSTKWIHAHIRPLVGVSLEKNNCNRISNLAHKAPSGKLLTWRPLPHACSTFQLGRGTPSCSYSYKAPPNQVGWDEPFSSFFLHKFFFSQLWWCCRAIVVTARLLLRSLLTFNSSVLFFFRGSVYVFSQVSFHLLWCSGWSNRKKKKDFPGFLWTVSVLLKNVFSLLYWPRCQGVIDPASRVQLCRAGDTVIWVVQL